MIDPVRLVRLYVWVLGAGLLLDGAGLLVLNALGASVPVNASDARHNLLHVVWGLALLVVSVLARNGHELRAAWASVVFGAFYVALGVLGVTLANPFGLQLGPGENAFHFTVGPLALVLGAWALRSAALWQAVPSASAVRPGGVRTGPLARQRANHRPGRRRAKAHRR